MQSSSLSMNIAILDSGVGGQSILAGLKKVASQHHYTYFADHKNFPYSTKSVQELQKIAEENVSQLIAEGAELIVIACNTLTVAALDQLRKTFPTIPFIGTVPPVKKAADTLPPSAKIIVVFTKHTAKSQYLKNLIQQHSKGQQFISIGTTQLVKAVENNDSDQAQHILKELFAPYSKQRVSAVIIGCTHFSFVKQEIRNCFPYPIQIFDSVEGITKQLQRITKNESIIQTGLSPSFCCS